MLLLFPFFNYLQEKTIFCVITSILRAFKLVFTSMLMCCVIVVCAFLMIALKVSLEHHQLCSL